MKMKSKTLLSRISQAGSMMIEAMAMLGLIALVTPTLYKKSAERTTELQDINTATHLRTIMKAVDSYVSANYQSLLEDQLKSEDDSLAIDLSSEQDQIAKGIHDYFPYGYNFNEVKNFGIPKVVLKRQGMSITSFVELPKGIDIGEMRAARIASMIGSNGGYVNADGDAMGVGGVWSLDNGELNSLGLTGTKGSIVVASSDAINSATSGALENEKYLQRTEVESTDQLWRNTMVTDLYMGGVAGADEMHKILGVDQLILGSTDWENHEEDLVLTNENGYSGSAWLAGSLSALSDAFYVGGNVDTPEMVFGLEDDNFLYVNQNRAELFGNEGSVGLAVTRGTDVDGEVDTDYATIIRNTLDVSGSTTVASADETTSFKAGPDGSYITADANRVALMDGNVEIARAAGEGATSTTNIKTGQTNITSTNTNITGDTVIGTTADGGRAAQVVTNPKLNVQGSTYVRDNLEVGDTLYTEKFNTKELHAGGTDFSDNRDNRWLHATGAGVSVTNPGTTNEIMLINNTTTQLYGPNGQNGGDSSALILSETTSQLRGANRIEIYTADADEKVSIQNGALEIDGSPGADVNTVNISANTTSVLDGVFQVVKTSSDDNNGMLEDRLYVNTAGEGEVFINSGSLTIDSNPLFRVYGDAAEVRPTNAEAVVEVDDQSLRVSSLSAPTSDGSVLTSDAVLYVDALDFEPKDEGSRDSDTGSSVYIRRGAIEVEAPLSGDSGYAADSGLGYIEANRLVSNALYNNSLAQPVYSLDYTREGDPYDTGEALYDRYMVNPAYTSVMHDIKLTTRGGARLSDILPDFINKGIYVVNNSYLDTGIDLDSIKVAESGGRLEVTSASCAGSGTCVEEVGSGTLSGANQWASPFMGVVPAPQCPPGYARVITITPAGFMMAQAGPITRDAHKVGDTLDGNTRFVVDEHSEINKLGDVASLGAAQTVTGAQYTTTSFRDESGEEHQIYYLGHAAEPTVQVTTNNVTRPYSPQPLYFQQNTWLRSKVQPQAENVAGACGESIGGECGDGFLGWSAIMGFVYPGSFYSKLLAKLQVNADPDEVYWNVFPVRAQTLEAYATVYCYFDRTDLYGSGTSNIYVDRYDQLNNFRKGYSKSGPTAGGGSNSEYINRLNDPALKYDEPW